METFFVFAGLILLIQSLLALLATLRFARYTVREASAARRHYQPKSVVIVPCKGLDEGFAENIGSLFAQEYPDYEIIFVTESEADPAYKVLADLIYQSHRAAWLVVAGESVNCGQKIHSLCAALETLDAVNRRAEVIVFADADARPAVNWLSELVAPLADEAVGATTGFRWYLPGEKKASLSALILSVWNASALGLLGERSAFAWGGATAIRRELLKKLNIRERWKGAVSDDYQLTRTLQEAGHHIKFVPACLMSSPADFSFRQILEFTTRQLIITKVYASRIWALTLVTHVLFNTIFWGGGVMLLISLLRQQFNFTLLVVLSAILLSGAISGTLRAVIAAQLLEVEEHRSQVRRHWWGFAFLSPLVSLLYLWNAVSAAFTRKIEWRGIGYELVSTERTNVLYRPITEKIEKISAETLPRGKATARSTTSS